MVLVSSVFSYLNGAGAAPYAMSKAAVEQLGRALRVELALYGASCAVAYFPIVDTRLTHEAIDANDRGSAIVDAAPSLVTRRISAEEAGRALRSAIEKRRPALSVALRWHVLKATRGIVMPLADRTQSRDPKVLDALRAVDQPVHRAGPAT